MNAKTKYLGIFLTLIFFGCKKPINEFKLDYDNQKETLKVYADSTFSLQSGENEYSGNWTGKLNEGDTISITSTMNGYNVMTLTPTESFKIINGRLTRIKKDGLLKEQNSKVDLTKKASENDLSPIRKTKFPILDTLDYHLKNHMELDKKFYNRIFDKNYILSNADKVFVKQIKPKVNGINPVILSFQTVESDRDKEYIDLHLFNEDWILKKSLSLKYDIHYALFDQEYEFISDSIIQVRQDHGLSFENDSTVQRVFTLKIDRTKLLDTLKVQIDTLEM